MSTDAPKPPKSKLGLLLLAAILAVAAVLLITFRPVTDAETVVADDGKPVVYEPVVYDTSTWQSVPMRVSSIDELSGELGSTATEEDALDFYGNQATRYRYSAKQGVPFYSIDSAAAFEVVWYYPAPTDDDATKNQAVEYAKRVYRMMGRLGGETGTAVVAQMLRGDAIAPKSVGTLKLVQGRCEHYQCRVVFDK